MKACGLRWKAAVLCIALSVLLGPVPNLLAATEDYAGAYTCTFSGDMTGMAIFHVNAQGSLQGVIWSDQQQTVDYVAGWASADDNGNFSFTSHCDMQVQGAIQLTGEISGNWTYKSNNGSVAGQKDTGSMDPYAGNYQISIQGDISGTGSFTISSQGTISGEIRKSGESQPADIYLGMADSQGNLISIMDDETAAKGQIDPSGNISGEWRNNSSSGTFKSSTAGSSGSSGDGGGGGGCFIGSIVASGAFSNDAK